MDELFEYIGVFHVHTEESDGTKTHEELIKVAKDTKLDFVVFNDHNTMKRCDFNGWHDNILAIVGYELEDKNNKNHYLVLGLDHIVSQKNAFEYVKKVSELGGVGIIAHPDEIRDDPDYPSYEWTDWDVKDFDGIEIWNHLSSWMEEIITTRRRFLFFTPRKFLTYPPQKTLERWDNFNKNGHYAGIGSVDAHAHKYYIGPFWRRIFPYKVEFKSIRSHLIIREKLPEYSDKAIELFLNCARKGNLFISNYKCGNAKGFRYYLINMDNSITNMGETTELSRDPIIYIKLPKCAEIRIIKNGVLIHKSVDIELRQIVYEKGFYRVEIYKDNIGWIYSNPIWVI